MNIRIAILAAATAAACTSPSLRITRSGDDHLLTIEGNPRYIMLPVEEAAPSVRMEVLAGDSLLQTIDIHLAQNGVDYLVPLAADAYPEADRYLIKGASADAAWIRAIALADRHEPQTEKFRPTFHHTPPYGWMNDPNSMFYLDGKWHLYYQYNPYGSMWGNMHWGHSVSDDLINWEYRPVAISPDSLGTVFSGSCVIDTDGCAGFGKDAVIAIYTSAGRRQTQSIAYSSDGGTTFARYEGNPVVVSDRPDFRDPKVFRHEDSGRWVMIVSAGDNMEFYSSYDLKQWRYESSFGEGYGSHGGVWECPDMVRLPVDGDPARSKWVLVCNVNPGGPAGGSAAQYFTGDFDGHEFRCDTPPETVRWVDFGKDNYAAVTWHGAPDGRCVMIGWMSDWQYAGSVPTKTYRGACTLPRELALYSCGGIPYLSVNPVPEARAARGEASADTRIDTVTDHGAEIALPADATACEIEITIDPRDAEGFALHLACGNGEYFAFNYDALTGTLAADRSHAGECGFSPHFAETASVTCPLSWQTGPKRAVYDGTDVPPAGDGRLALRIFVDRSSVECFEAHGRFALTSITYPSQPFDRLRIISRGGECRVEKATVYPLRTEQARQEAHQKK